MLRSLKTPEEIDRLREVYGESCYVVAAYASREHRRNWLAQRIAKSQHATDWERHISEAEHLIERDAHERVRYGQNVRDTFPLADVFLDAAQPAELKRQAERFVVLFGHPYTTPTRDEHAMFLAAGAALRSASPGRQVGATIATPQGDVVVVGTNGTAPRLYMRVFAMLTRKAEDGQWSDWNKIRRGRRPRYHESPDGYINKEENGSCSSTRSSTGR